MNTSASRRIFRGLVMLWLMAGLLGVPSPAAAANLLVNSANDLDDGHCDARHCSLREAVNAANENPGPDTITFNIPGPAPHVIHLGADLWMDGDGTTVDGTTQPGYSADPTPFGTPAVIVETPLHLPEGRIGAAQIAFWIVSSDNTIRGLHLTTQSGGGSGLVEISGGSNNVVERNIIGLNLDGGASPAVGVILNGVSSVVRNNLIAAQGAGIVVRSGSHIIEGNWIGLNLEGGVAHEGLRYGVRVEGPPSGDFYFTAGAASETLIGGDGPGEGNVIAGARAGNAIWASGVEVIGNRIGTNAAGTAALPNGEAGIEVWGEGNVVRANLVSGHRVGVLLGHTSSAGGRTHLYTARNTIVEGNFIGTDAAGVAALPNGRGIVLGPEVETMQIGGADPSQANIISGNGIGIEVQGGSPTILGNRIGTNAAGAAAIPNEYGIIVWDRATDVRVGGAATGEGNLISGNSRTGLWLRSNAGVVQHNWIGLTADGSGALPNGTGLDIDGDSNQIGGEGAGAANVISGNEDGVVVDGQSNLLLGNLIGTNPSGSFAIPNAVGVYLSGDGNTLGEAAAPNLISGNGRGLVVTGSHNTIDNNRIGTDLASAAELPNGVGIELFGPYNQIGNGTLPGNQVLYNEGPGIRLSSLAVGNTIAGNTIAFNAQEGIRVEPGAGVSLNTFSRNSLYQNGWLGIDLLAGAQHDVVPPVIDSITVAGESTSGAIHGHACPGCQVELFLADPDPSGSGEGRTFYAAGPATDSGVFTSPVPPGIVIGICQPFTATATDAEGNTSEFSHNVTPFGCLHIPWIVVVLGVPALVVIGAGAGGLAGGPRGRPAVGGVVGGAAGGLIGVVIAVVLVRLPFVQIVSRQTPGEGGPPVAPLTPCTQFINSSQIQPEDGAAFDLGTDVLFELSPQPDPPGVQTRWTLHLSGPAGLEAAELLSPPSASLSSIGVDDPAPGAYLWRLSAERLDAQTGVWNPFCSDLADRTFFLLQPTPTAEPTAQPATPTVTVTPTPTSAPPLARLLQNANCRRGPGTVYDVVTSLLQGQTVPIEGRNAESTWWRVLPQGLVAGCWLAGSTVQTSGDLQSVQMLTPPPTPIQACWVQNCGQCPLVCTSPCPENAQPGGACTP